ncbi:MAG: glycosyl transferase [Clostridiales bacterium]|nr:glycosyl transferase [Clostridiales bacterium]
MINKQKTFRKIAKYNAHKRSSTREIRLKLLPVDGTHSVTIIFNKIFVGLTHFGFFKRMDDERYLKLLYRGVTGRPLHLNPPVRYSEKVQWLKLHDKNPMYPVLCDKVAVREFVRERAGAEPLVTLYGVWDDSKQIDFSALPERFVLKCAHDSGSAIICKDKASFDIQAAKQALKKRLKKDYSISGREWPYHDVPRRVIAEEFIGRKDGSLPDDYKFYCVRGKILWVCVCTNRREKSADYYMYDYQFRPFWTNVLNVDGTSRFSPSQPPHFLEMIELSERLSDGLQHVRVDLYDTPDGVRFGEMTLFDQSGFIPEYSDKFDRMLGGLLDLEIEQPVSELAKIDILDELRRAYKN